MIFLSILLCCAGLFMIFRPGAVWQLAESWKSADATEPSDLYLVSVRFGGFLCGAAGIASAVILLLT